MLEAVREQFTDLVVNAWVILALAAIFIPFERLTRLRDQEVVRSGWWTDATYALVNPALISVGIWFVLDATLGPWLVQFVPEALRTAVHGLPLWAAGLLVLFVVDLAFYTVHRLHHTVPFLWRFHSVHHSISTIDWMASYRVHVVDQVLHRGTGLLALYLLNVSDRAMVFYVVVATFQGLFHHANSRVMLGPFRWFIAGPEFHHWHHALEEEAHDRNYAGFFPWIDWLFGTAYMPGGHPKAYGTTDPVPSGFLRQLVYPFQALLGSKANPS